MSIFDLFSKRQKKIRGEVSDVLTYDNIPEKLKVQILQIIREAIGIVKKTEVFDYGYTDYAQHYYHFIHNVLCKEYGEFSLGKRHENNQESIFNFFLTAEDTEKILDVVEVSFEVIGQDIKNNYHLYLDHTNVAITPDEAISELNQRFKENAIGYQFIGGEIIRVDSTYAHSEITKPTIALLQDKNFAGANEEYLKAHEHYRHGRNKECLAECLKAFESTLKIICKEKGWAFSQNDTSSKLIQTCFDNDLIPSFSQSQFASLRSLLESGIPTIRNRLGGHGQGQVPQKVDDEITRYAINLTGANIIFLIEQSRV